jgi:hypothetical protein
MLFPIWGSTFWLEAMPTTADIVRPIFFWKKSVFFHFLVCLVKALDLMEVSDDPGKTRFGFRLIFPIFRVHFEGKRISGCFKIYDMGKETPNEAWHLYGSRALYTAGEGDGTIRGTS